MWGFAMSLWLVLMRFQQSKRVSARTETQKEVIKLLGKPTRYGWMIRLNDGRLIEVATEEEARELLESEE